MTRQADSHQRRQGYANGFKPKTLKTRVGPDGQRSTLGCSVQLSEAESHWRKFLESLVARGLHGVKLAMTMLVKAHSSVILELQIQEPLHKLLALFVKKDLAAVLAARDDFKITRSLELFVFFCQLARLFDRNLRVLVAVNHQQRWICCVNVLGWTSQLG